MAMYSRTDIFQNPNLLRFLSEEEQTPDLCWTAVISSCYAIRYVKRQTDNLVQKAVLQDPYCLLYVKNPSTDILWSVLENDPYNLKFVRSPTPDMIRWCLQRGGPGVLRYLQEETETIRQAVHNYNPRFVDFITANPVIPIRARRRIVIRGGTATAAECGDRGEQL